MWEYNYTQQSYELYHYGVPGMRWGHRKYYNSNGSLNSAGKARQSYKSAKKELKSASKQYRKDSLGLGMKAIQKSNRSEKKYNAAEMKVINAKAKFKASKTSDPTKAKKAEFKTYRKEMSKSGLAGSAADRKSGGRSTRIYNELTKKKGKAYADKVAKSVQNRAVATLVGAGVVAIGSAAAQAYLATRD